MKNGKGHSSPLISNFTAKIRYTHEVCTQKKEVEPKWLHPGAVLENGATLEGGAVFSLNNHV